jgi:hypothetical protein
VMKDDHLEEVNSPMNASKLTMVMMFAASMAWVNVANAEEPCGAPVEGFKSCQVVEAPHCAEVCAPDAMTSVCVAGNSDQCMAECTAPGSVACPAACDQQCSNLCAAEIFKPGPQQCVVSCGASCMGDCAAECAGSGDKTTCYAKCGQTCDAYCEVRCDVQEQPGFDVDYGFDETQEREGRGFDDWRTYYANCKKRYKRNYKRICKNRRDWEKDYYKRCRQRHGRNWRKFCRSRAHYDRYRGFEIRDHEELTWEFAEGGVDEIASQCQTECQQSCSGVCESSSVQLCERDCETQVTDVCAPQMTSACVEECNRGAVLVCDGQWLDVRDVDACVAAREHEGIGVEGPVSALQAGELVIDTLQAASCSIEEPSKRGVLGTLFALLGLGLGAGFLRRRRC